MNNKKENIKKLFKNAERSKRAIHGRIISPLKIKLQKCRGHSLLLVSPNKFHI